MIGLSILVFAYGDFAEVGQLVPRGLPGRAVFVYASGLIMLFGGIGLVFKRTATWSVRVLFPFLVIGLLLQVPSLVTDPLTEVNWESAGELGLLLSGGWTLFATHAGLRDGSPFAFAAGENGLRLARIVLGLWLLPIGLSHFAYMEHTTDLVPAWLPFRRGWVYLTGGGHIAAGLGVLFNVVPRLAAMLEAGMLAAFTILVWGPKIVAGPWSRGLWTEFVVSWAITSSVWLVASSFMKNDAPSRSIP